MQTCRYNDGHTLHVMSLRHMQVNLTLRMFEGCHTSVAGTPPLWTYQRLQPATCHFGALPEKHAQMLILMCTADGAASIRRSATVPQGSMLLAQFTVHC